MNNKAFLIAISMIACTPALSQQACQQETCKQAVCNQVTDNCTHLACQSACNTSACATAHPWRGKRIGFIGDSMTDPKNNSRDVPKKYWAYLQEWLGITPYVYGVSGRQWNDVPRQAEKLMEEHGDSVDAITVFIGTNDFNAGVPVGEWYSESTDTVLAAANGIKQYYVRKHRTPIMDVNTFRGRINIAMKQLKTLYPDKQIVLLTPIHRGDATFKKSIQPNESWQNLCGEYFDAYVNAVKEAGNVWAVPVIDLNSVSGMNPMVEAQQQFFRNPSTDLLHPSDNGQRRLAQTLVRQLMFLPVE